MFSVQNVLAVSFFGPFLDKMLTRFRETRNFGSFRDLNILGVWEFLGQERTIFLGGERRFLKSHVNGDFDVNGDFMVADILCQRT